MELTCAQIDVTESPLSTIIDSLRSHGVMNSSRGNQVSSADTLSTKGRMKQMRCSCFSQGAEVTI